MIDHHWYFSSWGDRVVRFDRVDEFDSRDIDPTIWLDHEEESQSDIGVAPLTELKTFKTDFQARTVAKSLAWTKTFEDLLDPIEVIETVDARGRRWWATHLWYQDKDYLAKLQSTNAFRTAQAALNMIIIHQADLAKFIGVARGRNFGNDHMLSGGETVAIFVGEHSWDSGVFALGRGGQIELTEKYYGVRYCVPTVRLATKRGEYDLSTTIDKSITAPNADLVVALKMHVEGPTATRFVIAEKKSVFIDTMVTNSGDKRTVVHAEELERVLAAQGLCPLWVFWSEKDGGLGHGPNYTSHHDQVSRTVFGGCFWRSNGSWQTSGLWLVEQDRQAQPG